MKITRKLYDKNINAIYIRQEKDHSRLLLGVTAVSNRIEQSVDVCEIKKVETTA